MFVGIILLSIGCDGGQTKEDNVYRIGDEQGDWGYPTPFAAYPRGPGYVRTSFIFDTLVWKDEDGFIPSLASEWEYDEENLSYIFELQEDVKWHDGEKMSADDVVFTYEYLQEKPYNWADLSVIEDVKKLDDKKVEINLKEPVGAFLNSYAGVIQILPEHIWSEVDNPAEYSEEDAVVGTGPYILKDYDRDKGSYRYKANDEYFMGEPRYDELHFVQVSDPQMAIQRGDVNFVQIEPEAVSNIEEQGLEIISGNHDWNLKLMFNHEKEPFDTKDFRRGLAYFIDDEMIVDRALRGYGLKGAAGLISPDSRFFNEDIPEYNYDISKGEMKLKDIGYELQDGFFVDEEGDNLELEIFTSGDFTREGELVRDFLREAGIKAEVRSFESSVLDERIRNSDFELAIIGHGGIGGDPHGISNFMVGKSRPHINIQYEDDLLIEKLEKKAVETDEEKRKELVKEVQKIYASELPAYTLYHPTWYYAHDKKVDWFFTFDGLGEGIPIPLNKFSLLKNN